MKKRIETQVESAGSGGGGGGGDSVGSRVTVPLLATWRTATPKWKRLNEPCECWLALVISRSIHHGVVSHVRSNDLHSQGRQDIGPALQTTGNMRNTITARSTGGVVLWPCI
ncbi:hypothetical protein E2C01_029543 [Portunus trituberculatus]|uniref:Uncharacterized protein n=1 Tax=Portunus trituberculatus TaxID=210409 RepID=A0A5B7ES80_PORTR|nr:hypothetical protein [Portunus trituberculatus]